MADYAMGLLDFQSLERTPAACFIAFQATLMVMTAATCLLGQTDGLYKFEPHTKKITSRQYELLLGGTLLGWFAGMVGALVAGGAHVMCILQLPPMLAATYYHYSGGGKSNVVVNVVFMVALAYLGFAPVPEVKYIEWTPTACFLAFHSSLVVMTAASFLLGQTDGLYKYEPHTKAIMSRQGEVQVGACLLGWGAGMIGAIVAGGAQDMCILQLPPLLVCTYHHYIAGGKSNVIVNTVVMVLVAYFGFLR